MLKTVKEISPKLEKSLKSTSPSPRYVANERIIHQDFSGACVNVTESVSVHRGTAVCDAMRSNKGPGGRDNKNEPKWK